MPARPPHPKLGRIGAIATLSAALLPILIGGAIIALTSPSMAETEFVTVAAFRFGNQATAGFIRAALTDSTVLLALMTVAIIAAFVAGFSIVRYSGGTRRQIILFAGAAVLAAVLSVATWFPPFDYEAVGRDVFSGTVAHMPEVGWLRTSLHIAGALTFTGLALLVVASAALMPGLDGVAARIRDYPTEGDEFQAAQIVGALRGRLMTLRILTAAGGVLLAASVAKLSSYLAIPGAFVMAGDAGAYRDMTGRLVMLHGAVYSVALFGMFIVPFGILRAQVRSFAIASGGDVAAFRKRHGLNSTVAAMVWDAAKIALPLLVAAVPVLRAILDR